MISSIIQALDPLFQFATSILYLPNTIWQKVSETIRTTVSLNGYTAIDPDGVLDEKDFFKDEKEEGEEKEEK